MKKTKQPSDDSMDIFSEMAKVRQPLDPDPDLAATSSSPIVEHLRAQGVKVMRQKYLALAYPDGLPKPWTAELELELPEFLQRKTRR